MKVRDGLSVLFIVSATTVPAVAASADRQQRDTHAGLVNQVDQLHERASTADDGNVARDEVGTNTDTTTQNDQRLHNGGKPSHAREQTSPSELYAQALRSLDSATRHAPTALTSRHTRFSPLLKPSSSTPMIDYIESLLGSRAGYSLRTAKSVLAFVYGGSKYNSANEEQPDSDRDDEIDWSIRGAVNKVTKSLSSLSTVGGGDSSQTAANKRWFDKLTNLRSSKRGFQDDELENALVDVLDRAKHAGELGNADAWNLRGDLYLAGHLTLAENASAAVEAYTRASEDYGSAEAQYKLGFLYASNFGGAFGGVEGSGSQGSALLHYTFAALSKHVPASMTVGYRHWMGIGTKKSCKDALGWYKAAADAAMRSFNSGPPGGRHLPPPKLRLSDLNGGAYGPGASASQRSAVTGGSTSQTQQEWDDLIEFHHFHASRGRGDPMYMFRLARLYYQGFGGSGFGGVRNERSRLKVGMPGLSDKLGDGGRDFVQASRWFLALTAKVWRKDVPRDVYFDPKSLAKPGGGGQQRLAYDESKDQKLTTDEHTVLFASLAAGYLGRMYMRGEGTAPNYAKAYLWFSRGASQGDRESNNGLGILFRDGLGIERDVKKANTYFHAAAQHDLAEAQVNLGKFHFGMGEYALATTYFEHAIRTDGTRVPDTFQSFYYLAELNARALNRDEQCPVAVSFYKIVAERGDWDHEVWWEAERALLKGDERTALLGYWIMAERGYEAAQNNVAWIMDRGKQRLQIPPELNMHQNESDRLALTYWTRSAAQDNIDALVKTGDYYFSGYGCDEPQPAKAAALYQSAATTRVSAMAMWNLGWMHETGRGVARDFHLAKRYYDQALETSADAYFPACLSLISLYARASYHALFASPDDELKAMSLLHDFVAPRSDEIVGGWGVARMWRDIQRRWGVELPPEEQFEQQQLEQHYKAKTLAQQRKQQDQVQADARRREEQRALDAVDEDDWRTTRAGGGQHDGDDDEDFYFDGGDGDFGGTVAIVGLCCLLGWLLYFRQGRVAGGVADNNVGGLDGRVPPHEEQAAAPGPAPVPAAGAADDPVRGRDDADVQGQGQA
ncbi:hypothetical protein ACM66B_000604 [Microbotryomycetes sp. NB124-2]